jgi:glycosyltransferase involved in cell wall biosynthesis
MIKISYAITVCDEAVEIQRLITHLLKHKRVNDEIVVLFDESKNSTAVEDYIRSHSVNGEFNWYASKFEGHFANWKNKLRFLCSGDYIFQIDADEIPNEYLIENLHNLLEQNSIVDMFVVPRINTVEGLTQEHIQKWRWNINEQGWVNFPDYQSRIYKNAQEIKWEGNVHEKITGAKSYAYLPALDHWCLNHPKTIERQEKQNSYYNTL